MTLENHDICPKCNEQALPRFSIITTAVCCQSCGAVIEIVMPPRFAFPIEEQEHRYED